MNKIAYTNETSHTQFFGGVMIPAGETREIDPTFLPDYNPSLTSATEEVPAHIVDHLLSQSSTAILAALPSLCMEDVELLGEKEQQGAARQEVLAALAERLLTSASEQQGPIVPEAIPEEITVEAVIEEQTPPEKPTTKTTAKPTAKATVKAAKPGANKK